MADETKTKVTILTGSYRIKGYIDLIPGARLTDYIVEAKSFVAVTEGDVTPPGTVTNFHLNSQNGRAFNIGWNASGDDGPKLMALGGF